MEGEADAGSDAAGNKIRASITIKDVMNLSRQACRRVRAIRARTYAFYPLRSVQREVLHRQDILELQFILSPVGLSSS